MFLTPGWFPWNVAVSRDLPSQQQAADSAERGTSPKTPPWISETRLDGPAWRRLAVCPTGWRPRTPPVGRASGLPALRVHCPIQSCWETATVTGELCLCCEPSAGARLRRRSACSDGRGVRGRGDLTPGRPSISLFGPRYRGGGLRPPIEDRG